MVNNPETLENVIAASPGLEKDPVAIGTLSTKLTYVNYTKIYLNTSKFT